MMSGCILFGHSWSQFEGIGIYAGQQFKLCRECGIPYTAEREAAEAKQKQEEALIDG